MVIAIFKKQKNKKKTTEANTLALKNLSTLKITLAQFSERL